VKTLNALAQKAYVVLGILGCFRVIKEVRMCAQFLRNAWINRLHQLCFRNHFAALVMKMATLESAALLEN
jgi:hypothetical protein